MRVSILSTLLLAGIATAAPTRIVMVSETIQYKGISSSGEEIKAAVMPVGTDNNRSMRRPCSGSGKTATIFSFSQTFRYVLGLAPSNDKSLEVTNNHEERPTGGARFKVLVPPMGHPHRSGARYHEPYMMRLHRALLMLGPWEGRAVAFVFGCGLGVLLRVAFLLVLLTYRWIFNKPESTSNDDDAEEYLLPPPVFNLQYGDDKQAIVFEEAPAYEVVEAAHEETD